MQKTRYDFALIQALAITLIVLIHASGDGFRGTLGVFTPLRYAMVAVFVFISGYFSAAKAAEHPVAHIRRKFRSLIVPLYALTLLYAALVLVLHQFGISRGTVSLEGIVLDPLTGGHALSYNIAMWFIAPLFFCQAIYALSHWLTNCLYAKHIAVNKNERERVNNEQGRVGYLVDFVFVILGFVVILPFTSQGCAAGWKCLSLRTAHFLAWFSLGRVYRDFLEARFRAIRPLAGLLIYLGLQLAVIFCSNGNFDSIISWVTFEGGFWSILMMLDGLFGYLLIGKVFEPVAQKSKTIALISKNTFAIMCHHLLGIFVLLTVPAVLLHFLPFSSTFDMALYSTNTFYHWFPLERPEFCWIYVIFAMAFSIWFQARLEKTWAWAKASAKKLLPWPLEA